MSRVLTRAFFSSGSNPVRIAAPPELAGMTLESRLVSYDWDNQFQSFQEATMRGSFKPICWTSQLTLLPVSFFLFLIKGLNSQVYFVHKFQFKTLTKSSFDIFQIKTRYNFNLLRHSEKSNRQENSLTLIDVEIELSEKTPSTYRTSQ